MSQATFATVLTAQPAPPDRPCTFLAGAPFALCSALPPAATCRHARHNRSWHAVSLILSVSAQPTPWRQALHDPHWGTARAMLGISAQPTLGETVGTLLPLMAIIPPSVPSAINRPVSPTVDKSGEALASPTARNLSHGLPS